MRKTLTTTALCLGAISLTACSSSGGSGGESTVAAGEKVKVTTSFYALEFATKQIGGDHVEVTSLVKPGAEPHDLELGAQDIGGLSKADLVFYSKGFQPSVDEAVDQNAKDKAVDVSSVANLNLSGHDHEHGHEGEGEAEHSHGAEPEGEHAHEGETAEEHSEHAAEPSGEAGHDHEGEAKDPHFWLDPTRYKAVADDIAEKLAAKDPANANTYRANAKAFSDRLVKLDGDFSSSLKGCTNKQLVTSHEAFGYLAQRYGFEQVGITGLDPEAEPSAAKLKQITDLVKTKGVTTVYAETLVEPAFANTVAKTTGAQVKVLDPIEGISDKSAGKDYFEVMTSNLNTLKQGQSCK